MGGVDELLGVWSEDLVKLCCAVLELSCSGTTEEVGQRLAFSWRHVRGTVHGGAVRQDMFEYVGSGLAVFATIWKDLSDMSIALRYHSMLEHYHMSPLHPSCRPKHPKVCIS